MANRIFVTYNPNVAIEQNTALRLQTIANLYGLTVDLPSRLSGNGLINTETKNRINNSDFVLALSLYKMEQEVNSELGHAIAKKKPILAIYQEGIGKNIDFTGYPVDEVSLDINDTEAALHNIANFIQTKFKQNKDKDQNAKNIAILGIALGMLALWSLNKEK